jgi:hypothetical protein
MPPVPKVVSREPGSVTVTGVTISDAAGVDVEPPPPQPVITINNTAESNKNNFFIAHSSLEIERLWFCMLI